MGLQGRALRKREACDYDTSTSVYRQSKRRMAFYSTNLLVNGRPTSQWGRSALHYASAGRDVSVVLHLHSIGLDINSKDKVRLWALRCLYNTLTYAHSANKLRCTWPASKATSPWQRASLSNVVLMFLQTK